MKEKNDALSNINSDSNLSVIKEKFLEKKINLFRITKKDIKFPPPQPFR